MAINTIAHAARMLSKLPEGKSLVVGSIVVSTLLDDQSQYIQDGSDQPLLAKEKAVLIAKGSVSVSRGTSVTYDGVAYTVRDVLPIENGDLQRVYLVSATP